METGKPPGDDPHLHGNACAVGAPLHGNDVDQTGTWFRTFCMELAGRHRWEHRIGEHETEEIAWFNSLSSQRMRR